MIDVSVVIPARDVALTLPVQLRALAAQRTSCTWEVILADHGSSDETRTVAQSHDSVLPDLQVVDASGASGVSAVRNLGIAAARGRYVLFCDGDDAVCPGWIAGMRHALDEFDVVGGAIRTGLLNRRDVIESRPQGLRREVNHWPGFLPWVLGANLGARLDVLQALGGFNESFPLAGGDDIELCWRAQLNGYTLGFAPDAAIEYRLRAAVGASLGQGYRYAHNEAHLYRTFRDAGMPRRRLSTVAKSWVRSPLDIASGHQPGGRTKALREVTKNLGRVRGSLRYRVLYL